MVFYFLKKSKRTSLKPMGSFDRFETDIFSPETGHTYLYYFPVSGINIILVVDLQYCGENVPHLVVFVSLIDLHVPKT